MIIIFINELKNITHSFLKMNYIKDMADVTIKKYCNGVYCEAETGRFNLAKNSYDLLLPNDIFNTKTYYYMILVAVIILYIGIYMQFKKYNNLYYPYINDLDGTVFITYIKYFPFILGFVVLLFIIGIIIRRYAPNETSGYKYYYNIDNKDIDNYEPTNINSILKLINFILTFLILSYIICIYFSVVPDSPESINKKASDYYYLIFGYLFFTFIFIYFLLNIMNILMTFNVNKNPSLDNIDFKKNIVTQHNNVKIRILASDKYKEYETKNLLKSIYTFKRDNYNVKTSTDDVIKFWTNKTSTNGLDYWKFLNDDKFNSIYDTNKNKFGLIVHSSSDNSKDPYKVHCVIYSEIDYAKNYDNAVDIKTDDLRLCPNFLVFLVPILHKDISSLLKGVGYADDERRYQGTYNKVDEYVTSLRNDFGLLPSNNTTTYDELYALDTYHIENANLINHIITNFEYFINGNPVDKDGNPVYLNYYNMDIFKEDEENKRKNHMNVLLNITIKLCENAINLWDKNEENADTKIYKDGAYNTEYFERTIYPDFLKQTALVKLINNLINMKYKYNKKWSEFVDTDIKKDDTTYKAYIDKNTLNSINTDFNTDYKTYMNEYLKVLTDVGTGAGTGGKKSEARFLFANDYKILRDNVEINENYSVDLSYDSPNTFYEKYYNIVGGDYLSKEYKVGDYYVKNIKSLVTYVFLLIIFSVIVVVIMYYMSNNTEDIISGSNMTNYSQFLYNIVIPMFILLIFVIYIYLFINFNTEYNLNIVYGIFDSSYKRSLNSLNNIIIPYIKIHHDATENITSDDYFDLYIITNVLTSIINGNLELSNYQANTGDYNNNQDPLKIITGADAQPPMYQSYSDIVSIGKLFIPIGNTETTKLEEFNAYYNKVYERLYENFENTPTSQTESEVTAAKAEIAKKTIYKFINNINYQETGTGTGADTGASAGTSLFKYNSASHSGDTPDSTMCNKTIPEILSGTSDTYTNPINKYIYQIIHDNYKEIYDIILICKKLFNKNDFNKNVFVYNEQIKKGLEVGILKYFHFYNNNEEGIIPYKFILKMAKGDYQKFKSVAGIRSEDIAYLEDDNKNNIQNIIVNFLVITAHIKYNYNLINKDDVITNEIKNIIKGDLLEGRGTYDYINSLNFFHSYKNKRLFSLFSNTSFANANKITEIDDTFKYTFATEEYDRYEADICTTFKNHNYIYNLLINNYNSRAVNISNNYLKNIIKTIYYQINNKDILIDNYGEQNINGTDRKRFDIYKDKSTNADPVNTILHKANQCVSVSFMGNYIANIILIAIVYNVGYTI